MAAESMDMSGSGGHGSLQPARKPNWLQADLVDYIRYSTSTGSSSTSISTPYTNTSGGLTPLSSPHAHSLHQSYRDGGDSGKDVGVLKGWFPDETGVSRHHGGASATWIRALTEITNTFLTNMLSTHEDGHVQSARFAQESVSKMLPFVDDILADPNFWYANTVASGDAGSPPPAERLRPLIAVREAVSRASQDIRLSLCHTSSVEATKIIDEMASLLLSKQGKLDEAIWDTMKEARALLAEDDDGSWSGAQTPQGSSDIHKLTRATMSYIVLLSNNWATAHKVVDEAAQIRGYAPKFNNMSPLASLMMETVSCLEEKVADKSRSFPDQSLRFLFLTNNSYFIWEQLHHATLVLETHMDMAALSRKIGNYIETYVQVSWAPVLSCLYTSRPLCMGIYSSPAKFLSEFQKTYDAQKLWKVPDPQLRRRLRVAVIEKVVPSFAKYLEYNGVSSLRTTPQDLMDTLQELFEG